MSTLKGPTECAVYINQENMEALKAIPLLNIQSLIAFVPEKEVLPF